MPYFIKSRGPWTVPYDKVRAVDLPAPEAKLMFLDRRCPREGKNIRPVVPLPPAANR